MNAQEKSSWILALLEANEALQANGKIDLNKAEEFFAIVRDQELFFGDLIEMLENK